MTKTNKGNPIENPVFLSISLVLYQTPRQYLKQTLATLGQAIKYLPPQNIRLTIIENSPNLQTAQITTCWRGIKTEIISGRGNSGFGKAHNILLNEKRLGRFHLILNPDVHIAKDAIENGLNTLLAKPDIGLCGPAILDKKQQISHLGRRYPDLLSLGLRGFAPEYLKQKFRKHLNFYEINDQLPLLKSGEMITNIPCLSGSFLLMRGTLFQKLRGFNPNYFLYFEDFDFSIRAQKHTRTAILPDMRIRHFGGNTCRKGLKHLCYFSISAFRFFQTHGWRGLKS